MDQKPVLDEKTGWYRLSGDTIHCMCRLGYGCLVRLAGDGSNIYTYNKNSRLDGSGKRCLDDVRTKINSRYFDCFVVLDTERTRESKPNFGLDLFSNPSFRREPE